MPMGHGIAWITFYSSGWVPAKPDKPNFTRLTSAVQPNAPYRIGRRA